MARIKVLPPTEVGGELEELYEQIKARMGLPMVPNIFQTFSLKPAILGAVWGMFRTVMLGETEIPRELKEMIAVVVSKANNCHYCVAVHSFSLQLLGLEEERVEQITRDYLQADLDERTKAILDFAVKVSKAADEVGEEEVDSLRRLGLSDGEILEIVTVVAMFNAINRVADALGVELP